MPSAAVLTTIGVGVCSICGPMSGPVITSSSDVICGSNGSARIGDIVMGFCGHPGTIVGSSSTVVVDGRGKARMGDAFAGLFSGVLTSAVVDTIDVGG